MRILVIGLIALGAVAVSIPQAQSQSSARPTMANEADFRRAMKELSNWGRWGNDDELGAANLITPAKRKQALALATEGLPVTLAHDVVQEHAADAPNILERVLGPVKYGLMQAYAEGFNILRGAASEALPEDQRYQLDLPDIAEVWRRGSVIGSWLLDLTAMALAEDPKLDRYSGFVEDSGEGRWTIMAAIEEAVPAEVLSAALYARFRSREQAGFSDKLLSAMRNKFGGHVEPKIAPQADK
jgi:6-phosphogluconate dehydrogenase